MLESLNYSFRNPKNNLSNLPHQTVEKLQKKNHGVLWGPQLGKQCWRPRLGILRVKVRKVKNIHVHTMKPVVVGGVGGNGAGGLAEMFRNLGSR